MSPLVKLLQKVNILPKPAPLGNGGGERDAVEAQIRREAAKRQLLRKEMGLDPPAKNHVDPPCGSGGSTHYPRPA